MFEFLPSLRVSFWLVGVDGMPRRLLRQSIFEKSENSQNFSKYYQLIVHPEHLFLKRLVFEILTTLTLRIRLQLESLPKPE